MKQVKALDYFDMVAPAFLNDESFTIPSEGTKLCVRMSKSLVNSLSSPTQSNIEFANWLICELKDILENCKRKNGLFNQDKLWSTFHQTTLSSSFEDKWAVFLISVGLEKDPLFYQHITDEIFNLLIKQRIKMPSQESQLEENDEMFEEMLTFEEENAVRYVGGYVIRVLKKQMLNSDVVKILDEFIEEDKENQDANTWVAFVDRGGLVRITEEAYQLFYAIETSVRRYLKVSNVTEMNDGFRKHITDCTVNDDNVLFYWSLAGQDECDKSCQCCLLKLVEKWVTIRGFSFAKNLLELYKQEEKKSTGKEKSLRSKLFT